MTFVGPVLILSIPLLVAVYTYNYAQWAWKKGIKRGAIGLLVLAAATILLPVFMFWQGR